MFDARHVEFSHTASRLIRRRKLKKWQLAVLGHVDNIFFKNTQMNSVCFNLKTFLLENYIKMILKSF
jgi:hypothetical protein